jgi:hypothetical protein
MSLVPFDKEFAMKRLFGISLLVTVVVLLVAVVVMVGCPNYERQKRGEAAAFQEYQRSLLEEATRQARGKSPARKTSPRRDKERRLQD